MIKTDEKYLEMKLQLKESKDWMELERDGLFNLGLSRDQVWMAMAKTMARHQRLVEEADRYLNAR